MQAAPEFQTIRPGLFFWQAYDPAVKTELSCCAFETPEGLIFCDPVRLAGDALAELVEGRPPRAILLTNGNHERDSVALAKRFGIEVWAGSTARETIQATRWIEADGVLFGGIEAISLDGFGLAETAFLYAGVLLVGDALIHAEPYGFSILPEKYCEDVKMGKKSLAKLLQLPVEIITFAHGLPIVSKARDRLIGLISDT